MGLDEMDLELEGSRARDRPAPIFGSWTLFLLVLAPYFAAAGAGVGYLAGGPKAASPAGVAGEELIEAFPLLGAAGVALFVIVLPLDAFTYAGPGSYWPWKRASALMKLGLVLCGWGALFACSVATLREHEEGLIAVIGQSSYGWWGSVEGRMIIGVIAGLAVGLALTIAGVAHERGTPRRAGQADPECRSGAITRTLRRHDG